MRIHRHRNQTLLALAAAATGVCLAAPAAHAEVFCVNAPTCVGTDKADVESALVAAQSNGTVDIVRIGAKATPYTGNATYVSDEKVTVIGAGRGATRLSPGAGAAITVVLRSPASEIRDLTIEARNASNGLGLSTNGTAKNVEVVQYGNETSSLGVRLLPGGVFEDSSVDVAGRGVERFEAGASATIRDSVIGAGMTGVTSSDINAGLTVERTRVTAGRSIFFLGGSATITNVVGRTTTTFMDDGIFAGSGANVVAHHVTLIGGSMGNALSVNADTGKTSSLTVRNSIVLGFSRAFARGAQGTGVATLGVSYSRVTGPSFDQGNGSITLGAGTTALAPQFVDVAAGDYRLRGDSPLIDAGDTQNVISPDVDGIVRPVNGRADMGAYEYRRRAPVVQAAGPATLAIGAGGTFTASATDADGDLVTYAWSFGGSGASVQHAFDTPGLQTVTVTATDSGGATSTASVLVDVPAPPPVQNPPAQDPPVENPPAQDPPSQNPPTQNPPAKDRLAPVFKSLSASKKVVKFSLSEPAKVSLRVERAKGKRWVKVNTATTAHTAGRRSVSLKKLKLGKGRYRVTVTAVDAAGNTSKPRSIGFTVR